MNPPGLALCLFLFLGLLALPARADHPLMTEDADVLGKGVREIEVHGERSRDRQAGTTSRATEAAAVFAYGATDRVDIQIELPYVRESERASVEGRGDVSLALKWQLFEREGLKLALQPDLHLPTGREEPGLGAGKTRWGISAVAGYAVGRWELLAHGGYLRNRNVIGERSDLRHFSVAALFAATEALTLVLDLGRDTNPQPGAPATREAVLGAILALSEDVNLGVGMKRGLNDAAEDHGVLLGLKVRF